MHVGLDLSHSRWYFQRRQKERKIFTFIKKKKYRAYGEEKELFFLVILKDILCIFGKKTNNKI